MGVLSRKMAMQTSPKNVSSGIFRKNKRLSVDQTRQLRVYSDISPLLGAKYETYKTKVDLNTSIYKNQRVESLQKKMKQYEYP